MLKGDLRKKQILDTAETLFAERGYDSTSVQDILDLLQLSKGSFYHHFESKEQVLQILCETKAVNAAEHFSVPSADNGTDCMNCVLFEMLPLHDEGLSILKVILSASALPEGIKIRSEFQKVLKKVWLPSVIKALEQMNDRGEAFTIRTEETAAICLDLMNDLWIRIADEIFIAEKTGGKASPAKLLQIIVPYRTAMENLFSAAYGSIYLIGPDVLTTLSDEIHRWWSSLQKHRL